MKKTLLIVIALALVFTLALTLAACGGSTEQNPDSGTPSTPDGGQSPETPDGGEQTPETPDEGDEGETPTPPVTYTVTFETNGGSTVKAVTVDEGDAITPAPETTLEGYEFGGWYSSSDLSDDSLVTFPYTPADNTTLYAKWSKILTAADLYNEVFGEDYAFVSFENEIDTLLSALMYTTPKFLIANVEKDDFTIYANILSEQQGFTEVHYVGNQTADIFDHYNLCKTITESGGLLSYTELLLGEHEILMDSQKHSDFVNTLQELRNQLENGTAILSSLSTTNCAVKRLITNTTTEIEFADFAAKFMPAGVTPIACYVGALFGRYMESSQNPYFNTGYYDQFDACFVYIDTEGFLNIVEVRIVVPWYTNSTDESLYASALKEEGKNYKISRSTVTTIENPIWTGYTVGVTK